MVGDLECGGKGGTNVDTALDGVTGGGFLTGIAPVSPRHSTANPKRCRHPSGLGHRTPNPRALRFQEWSHAKTVDASNPGLVAADALDNTTYLAASLIWHPFNHVDVGVEYLWGERENADGNSGDASRFLFSTRMTF